MRFEIVREVFLKELRETLRDRRSLAIMFGVPVLLYPLLTMGLASLSVSTVRRMSRQEARVTVVHPAAAPHLLERMTRPNSGFRVVSPRDTRAALAENRVDAILILPDDLEARALAAEEVEIRVLLDRSRNTSAFTQRKLDGLLADYEKWVLAERLRAHGVPASVLRPLKRVTDDVAPADRRLGSRLALMLPMMLLLTGMLGAFFPALNATTMERELGTLEALLVTPATKMELLAAKGGLVLLSGLLTAGVNLLSMSLVLWRSFSMATRTPEAFTLDPGALALTYLAAVPTLIFFAAGVMVVGLFARNYREANAYATPVMLLSMVPMLVSITDPKTTPGLLVTPTVNTTLIIRDVLGGHASAGAFLLAFASSSLYAGLVLSLAARLFSTEQLVNPAWEPLSLKGLRLASRKRDRHLPAVDEALALFALSILLVLYVSPAWQQWGLLPMVAGNQLLLIAAPALLFAWLGRYRWVETFSWRRPSAAELGGAALIGVGLVPWINALLALQSRVWPLDPELTRAMARMFLPALQERPLLTVVAVGVLAGICEELLFRGPIQAALTRRLPAWFALGIGGFLFGAAHMYVQGLPLLTLIGVLLGWIVLRGGSIFPAMLLHAVYDITRLALSAWAVRTWGPEQAMEMATSPDTAILGPWSTEWTLFVLALGAVLLLGGGSLCASSFRRRAQLGRQVVIPA